MNDKSCRRLYSFVYNEKDWRNSHEKLYQNIKARIKFNTVVKQVEECNSSLSIEEEIEPPIVARGVNATAVPVYSTSKNSHHTIAEKDLANTLVATDYKDPPVVNDTEYIVRRLTPTECARLQGFPDWWCSDLGTENPTDEEIKN